MVQPQAFPAPLAVGDPGAADRARRIAGTVVVLLGIRGGFPLLRRALWMVMPRSSFRTAGLIRMTLSTIEGLVGLIAIIFFLVWMYRLLTALRARGEATPFSPGFAVGSWFIPLANFVLPVMPMTDAWRRLLRSTPGPVIGWWIAWLVFIVTDGVQSAMIANHVYAHGALEAIGWLALLSCLACYGLWILMVRRLTDALAARG